MRMKHFGWALMLSLVVAALPATARERSASDLTPYLQAEINEISMLSAQSTYLQQQGDPQGAALVASYIPDHQMQANMLASTIQARGGNPAQIQPNMQPVLGNRQAILNVDMQQHAAGANMYCDLLQVSDTATDRTLAISGLNGASRHFASLNVAQAATTVTPQTTLSGLYSALALEQAAVMDLEVQSARLRELGDMGGAQTLSALVPAHLYQQTLLEGLILQQGGDPNQVAVIPVAPLPTRDAIYAHARAFSVQLNNTYALANTTTLAGNPLQVASLRGQNIAMQDVVALRPTTVPAV